MRIAVIDMGTNTFNLLIAERQGTVLKRLYQDKIAVKIGEGGFGQKKILPQAWERGLEAMKAHASIITQYECRLAKALATSAIRDAINGVEFARETEKLTGIPVEIIDGDREAELIAIGVCRSTEPEEKTLIMDIGGGSTEFIIADRHRVYWKKSYPLGVTRLQEAFPHSDPITDAEAQALELHFATLLNDCLEAVKLHGVHTLTGSSGSFETFADMLSWKYLRRAADFSVSQGTLDKDQFVEMALMLRHSTRRERKKMNGLSKLRRDLIVTGALLTHFVLRHSTIDTIRYSTWSLREGALYELSEKNS